jgi:hypothetical protein
VIKMTELVQILNDAGQYEQEIKIATAALAIMAVPIYYTAKKLFNKRLDWLDKRDADLTPEQREDYRIMSKLLRKPYDSGDRSD